MSSGWFGGQQPLERITPDARWHLEVLLAERGHHHIGNLTSDHPLAELTDKGCIYRVLERGEHVGERRPRPAQATRGPEQRQTERPGRIVDGEPLSHVTTARCADEHGCVEPDRVHERADIVGEVAQPVAIRWLCGVAMPALVERERTDPLRQHVHQLVEAPQRVQPGVEQHSRNAIRIALLDVGQLKSVPKHGEMHHALILSSCAREIAPG